MTFTTFVSIIVVWGLCFSVWLVRGEKRLASPWFLYLMFHFIGFVLRSWFLYKGRDETFLRQWIGVWLFPEDHERAAWVLNIGLIAFTVGALIGEELARRRGAPHRARLLDPQTVKVVGVICVVFGFASYLLYGNTPWAVRNEVVRATVDTSQGFVYVSTSSAYITSAYSLVVGVFVVWIAMFGFRRIYAPILALYFLAMVFNGVGRTTYLVGFIAIALAVIGKSGRRWPSWKVMIPLLFFAVSFAAGKTWLQTLYTEGSGAAVQQARDRITHSYLEGQGELYLNYDVLASVVYLVPRHAPHSEFSLYGHLFYFWVPRAIWADKPVYDIPSMYLMGQVQTASFDGLTITLVGESFLAFALPGVVVLMGLYGLIFSFGSARCFAYPSSSVERIFGISINVVMFQVFRDGIYSYLSFTMFYFGPCALMWIASSLAGRMRTVPLSPEPDLLHPPALLPNANAVPRLGVGKRTRPSSLGLAPD